MCRFRGERLPPIAHTAPSNARKVQNPQKQPKPRTEQQLWEKHRTPKQKNKPDSRLEKPDRIKCHNQKANVKGRKKSQRSNEKELKSNENEKQETQPEAGRQNKQNKPLKNPNPKEQPSLSQERKMAPAASSSCYIRPHCFKVDSDSSFTKH